MAERTAGDATVTEPNDDIQLTAIHDKLRARARKQMAGERDGHTLQATALYIADQIKQRLANLFD